MSSQSQKMPLPSKNGGGIWDELMRRAEKDDLLLYVTALIGIFALFFVYWLDHWAHAYYVNYKQKKAAAQITKAKTARRSPLSVFFGSESGATEELAERLVQRFNLPKSRLINLAVVDPDEFLETKGIALLLIPTRNGGRPPDSIEWFVDWLQDIADDFRVHAGALSKLQFAVLGIGDSSYGAEFYNKAAKTLAKRLRALAAKPLIALTLVDEYKEKSIESQLDAWADKIDAAIDIPRPGKAEETIFSSSESVATSLDDSISDDDDEQQDQQVQKEEEFIESASDSEQTDAVDFLNTLSKFLGTIFSGR